jgi:hypothetical protein
MHPFQGNQFWDNKIGEGQSPMAIGKANPDFVGAGTEVLSHSRLHNLASKLF